MEKNVVRWYEENHIGGMSEDKYTKRIAGIKVVVGENYQRDVLIELAKCFMGVEYNENLLEGFWDCFTQEDMTFTGRENNEKALLAGIALYYFNEEDVIIPLLLILLENNGFSANNFDIYI